MREILALHEIFIDYLTDTVSGLGKIELGPFWNLEPEVLYIFLYKS